MLPNAILSVYYAVIILHSSLYVLRLLSYGEINTYTQICMEFVYQATQAQNYNNYIPFSPHRNSESNNTLNIFYHDKNIRLVLFKPANGPH
jgi:hypothetical protein